jgi:hypothetical protein
MSRQLKARVSEKILKKASRLFTGTPYGEIVELLQNARRAGATEVTIARVDNGDGTWTITFHDNGSGIADLTQLLNLAESAWSTAVRAAEDPAGMGIFCLSEYTTQITSGTETVFLDKEHWQGETYAEIVAAGREVRGTEIRFTVPQGRLWTDGDVILASRYGTLAVGLDGQPVQQDLFLDQNPNEFPIVELPDYGVRYQLREQNYYVDRNTWKLNFYGHVLSGEFYRGFEILPYGVRLEMTGAPTPLELVLPARENLRDTEASRALLIELERAIYRKAAEQPHQLSYALYQRAHRLGEKIPEAMFRVTDGPYTLWSEAVEFSDGPKLVDKRELQQVCFVAEWAEEPRLDEEVTVSGFALEKPGELARAIHAVWVYGTEQTGQPFYPVHVRGDTRKYSWAENLPRVVECRVEVQLDLPPEKAETPLAYQTKLVLCREVVQVVKLTDGREFRFHTPLTYVGDDYGDGVIFATRPAETEVNTADFWALCDTYSSDSDSGYDEQRRYFEEELEHAWLSFRTREYAASILVGQAIETLRSSLQGALPGEPKLDWATAVSKLSYDADTKSFELQLSTGEILRGKI